MSVSGKSVYGELKSKVAEAEQEERELSKELSGYERQITDLTNQREHVFGELASLYLPQLDAESITGTVRELQATVREIYQEKQRRRQHLDDLLQHSAEQRQQLNQELDTVNQQLEAKAEERDGLRRKIANELNENKAYTHLHEQAGQAQARLEQNKKRSEAFAAESKTKVEAYHQEPLFMYLLEREFGTSLYLRSGLTARLDNWVASLIDYKKQQRNYDFLQSMPEAIKEEIERQQQSLDKVVAELRATETGVEQKYGLPAVLQEGNTRASNKERILKRLQEEEQNTKSYLQERKESDSSKDKYHRGALDKLKAYLKGQDLAELKKRARATPDTRDDGFVEKIEQIDAQVKDLKAKSKGTQKKQSGLAERSEGLQRISRRYSQQDYESRRSYFDSGFDVNNFVTGYMLGRYSEHDVNHNIDSHQHWRPQETYASSHSYSGSSHSSHSSSSDSGFGGGGFDSGGGFGGGGFSTGGGF